MNKIEEMKNLVAQLNLYRDEYYNESNPSISDQEYDKLFDTLAELERETGVIISNSPTQTVGYEVKSKLEKVKHSHPMLSLDKTKSVDDLVKFSNGRDCIVSLKLDGLTILNTYNNSTLIQSETRGNGEEGEIVTHNAKVFDNLPSSIPYDRKFEIEGEAIITQYDFERINVNGEYKNCRNLASGSVRQLDSKITKDRHVRFIAWKIPFGVTAYSIGFDIAARYGFEVVPYERYNSSKDDINEIIKKLKTIAKEKGLPIDGLVITYDNIEYGKSLGNTGHHPRHSLAFKFYDDVYETTLRDIEWSMGKTGTLTPVAIFDSVEIDGTEVSRASLHNWSMCQDLELGIGDTITVYKANQIIPQVSDNLTRSNTITFPDECPICGALTKIVKDNDTKIVVCTNDDCQGKLLGKLAHAVSKNALNIDGMSEATIEFLINKGWVSSIKDLYHLNKVKSEWASCEGFGQKSVEKLLSNIEKSRKTTLSRLIYAQSIQLIGRTASKEIEKACKIRGNSFFEIMANGNKTVFLSIDGFGQTMLESLEKWADLHWIEFLALKSEFTFEETTETNQNKNSNVDLSGKTFVITGSLNHFSNRDELKDLLESMGAKVSGSVSAKTFALICNEDAGSSKSKKAKDLGVQIWTEEQLLQFIG